MYPVKVTETNFNIVLYRDGVGLIRGLKPREAGRTDRSSGKRSKRNPRAKQGFGWGKYSTRWIPVFIAIKDTGPRRASWRYSSSSE